MRGATGCHSAAQGQARGVGKDSRIAAPLYTNRRLCTDPGPHKQETILLKNKYIAVAAAVVAIGGAGATAVASMADAATAHQSSAAALKLGSVSVSSHGKHSLLET